MASKSGALMASFQMGLEPSTACLLVPGASPARFSPESMDPYFVIDRACSCRFSLEVD